MNSSTLPSRSAQATWKRVAPRLLPSRSRCWTRREPVADVAVRAGADGVQLDDRPLVAMRVALDPQQPRDLALLLVDVELVVWPEGAQRQAEQAQEADLAAAHGQAQRAHAAVLGPVALGEARKLPQRGPVGQPRAAQLAGARGHRSAL